MSFPSPGNPARTELDFAPGSSMNCAYVTQRVGGDANTPRPTAKGAGKGVGKGGVGAKSGSRGMP